MRVIYVAKHGCGDNDDEGAITHALQLLGCEVLCVHEKRVHRHPSTRLDLLEGDFCLFHKWDCLEDMQRLRMPRAFWYFDVVESSDPLLRAGSQQKLMWMRAVLPLCAAAFCTDGDFAAKNGLHHLMQGADERVIGPGAAQPQTGLLFAGMPHHGQKRLDWLAALQQRYGVALRMLGTGGPQTRIHGRRLADAVASAAIVLAPPSPSTDRYWSNRVYQMQGFQAFLLHPACTKLQQHYSSSELAVYSSWENFQEQVDRYLERPDERAAVAAAGYARTTREHLYRHRCAELLTAVEDALHGRRYLQR